MTVSDWGSSVAPRGMNASGRAQVYASQAKHRYIHPAHGGPAARSAPGGMPRGGFPPPEALGASAQPAGGAGRTPRSGAPRMAGAADGARLFNIIGAMVSVALVAGLAVGTYRLVLRDVSGVPVVRALEGPMRIQPEDPGGAVAPHQGLAVNGVAAAGGSAGPVHSVRLSPPAMVLSAEDVPAVAPAAPAAGAGLAGGEVTSAAQRPGTGLPMSGRGGEINADAAVAEALGFSGLSDMSGAGTSDTPIVVIPKSVPGVNHSPRPVRRPAHFAGLVVPTRTVDVSAPASAAATPPPARPMTRPNRSDLVLGREIAPEAIDPASRMVQLGTYKSADEARVQWQAFARMNPVLFHQRDWTVERSVAGGTPFFRLRAVGFVDLDDARGFCAALIAAAGTCVPVLEG